MSQPYFDPYEDEYNTLDLPDPDDMYHAQQDNEELTKLINEAHKKQLQELQDIIEGKQ